MHTVPRHGPIFRHERVLKRAVFLLSSSPDNEVKVPREDMMDMVEALDQQTYVVERIPSGAKWLALGGLCLMVAGYLALRRAGKLHEQATELREQAERLRVAAAAK